MAGPNLELFKFGLYLFFPIGMLVHYGNPVWYQRHVIPVSLGPCPQVYESAYVSVKYREMLFPKREDTVTVCPPCLSQAIFAHLRSPAYASDPGRNQGRIRESSNRT